MITFFPTPYTDELFYSVIARYKVWNGILDNKTLLRELYGKVSVTAGRQLPANFESLINNLPYTYAKKADGLIRENTVFKFYTAFATKEIAEKIFCSMSGNNGSNIYNTLGLSNNVVHIDTSLKYCEECITEDRINHGEAYWHLMHQFDRVLICNKHNRVLKVLNKSSEKINRQEYLNLEIEVEADDGNYIAQLDDRAMMLQKIYCDNIKKLIQMDFEYKKINYFREKYVEKLIKMEISDNRMKLNQEDIFKAFKGFYGEEYLDALGINFYIKNQYNWVIKICRKHRNLFHPMQHLLMIQFLNIDIEELFKKDDIKTDDKYRLQKKNIDEITERRKLWLTLKDVHRDLTVSELRKYDYSTYRWLLKYDKEWILKNSPKRKSKGNNHKVDWKQRDKEILALCKNAVSEILKSEQKPQRVSISLIGRIIGKQYLLTKYLDRLIRTKKFLEVNTESVKEFQERRITWVKYEYPNVAEWKQKRIIGVNKEQ
ncbi:hypothetical protein FC778_06920 [Clostridium botulinum]|nr:hypothetical protein [Clostridium botulinum]